MKNRIIALLAIIAVFGLALFAYAQSTSVNSERSSCCSKDSCPMKKKDASGKVVASCCDNCDCCKDGKMACCKDGKADCCKNAKAAPKAGHDH